MPAILITGGAGYIGSHTAFYFAQQRHKVVLLDSLVHKQQSSFHWYFFVHGDIADKRLVKKIINEHQIDTVIHCAALIDAGKSIYDPLNFYDNNVVKTLSLLEVIIACKIPRFIFSSSAAVYGAPQTVPMNEDHPKHPLSPYGWTKLMVERMLEDIRRAFGINYIALRYFNVAGAQAQFGLGEWHEPETHILPLLIRAALEQKPFTIFGTKYQTPDGTCMRDFVHVWDIAYAHWRAYQYLAEGNGPATINLGSGKGVSVFELIDLVQRVTGKKIKTLGGPARAGDPTVLVADINRARELLGWQPMHSDLERIVESAVEWEITFEKERARSYRAHIDNVL